jgi:ABC-type transport system, involved in lipoprotein release, permease component
MYIMKNALGNIKRSKGRSALFGTIIFIIALAACLALSIRAAADTAMQEGLKELSITGNITLDMDKVTNSSSSSSSQPSKSDMKKAMQSSSLSLTELKKYAKLSSVKSFYYTGSVSVDAKSIDAVTSSTGDGPSGMQDSSSGDFTITGYSSDEAMTDFSDGTAEITSGKMFTEGTTAYTCVISKTLAKYNDLSVGDYITFKDPDNSSNKFKVKIVGIYKTSTSTSTSGMGMMGRSNSNNVYMSYAALKKAAAAASIDMSTQGTYTFSSYANYTKFEDQAHDAGLASKYTVESQDIQQYERELTPLTNLSKYAKYFLIILLAIGGAILVVITLFNIRERKYEIGVLAAIGMSKKKIARQFIYEVAAIGLCAIILGGVVGSLTSVPVTNALLSSASTSTTDNFDRGGPGGGSSSSSSSSSTSSTSSTTATSSSSTGSITAVSSSSSSSTTADKGNGGPMSQYITSVTSAANWTVILELLGVGMILIFISGGAAVMTVMKYDPLAILTSRD